MEKLCVCHSGNHLKMIDFRLHKSCMNMLCKNFLNLTDKVRVLLDRHPNYIPSQESPPLSIVVRFLSDLYNL